MYWFQLAILQESENFSKVIERQHKSVICFGKTFAPSVKKRPDRLYKPTALDILVFLKIVKMVSSEARLK